MIDPCKASSASQQPIDAFNLHLLRTYSETIADGEGLRYAIYLAGCRHACAGCHNPTSWNPAAGILLDEHRLNEMIHAINSNHMLDGITLSGGDPFYNPTGLIALLQRLKLATNANIWCYTGYTIEAILVSDTMAPALRYIDVLIDGPFIPACKDPSLRFRGSSNQRIIFNPSSWKK